jgi:predicted RNase H-like nuclease (RuvC/YqgF family)
VALVGVQALAERMERLEQTSTSSQTESRLLQLEHENAQLRQESAALRQESAALRQESAALRQQSQQLQQRVEQLERLVEQIARGNSTAGGEQPMLGDAIPNPHDGTTTISCLVPRGVGQAVLRVSDVRGQVVRSELLPLRGVMVSVTVDMRDLPSGTYDYSLVLDGRVVATKQMQLVK